MTSSDPLIYHLPENESTTEVIELAADTLFQNERGKVRGNLSEGNYSQAKREFVQGVESQTTVLDYSMSPSRYVPRGVEGE